MPNESEKENMISMQQIYEKGINDPEDIQK